MRKINYDRFARQAQCTDQSWCFRELSVVNRQLIATLKVAPEIQ